MRLIERIGRHVLRRIRAIRQQRYQRLPRLHLDPAAERAATVYYLCPDDNCPSGGNRAIYRHVDALNLLGIAAKAMHFRDGFAYSWFEHRTPVVGAGSVRLTCNDILVVPETYGPDLDRLPAGCRVVIFNQNAYRTFLGVGPDVAGAPYRGIPAIEAVIVVSRDNAEYLRFAFPELPIARVRNAVDAAMFHPSPAPPGRRIAMMPRRNADAGQQVLHLLRARGCLAGWTVVMIDGFSERATAEALRGCSVFFSFSEREGFGLPPAEAMACGCHVVGFSGLAGREFFDPTFCTPVADGDILAFACAAERVLRASDAEINAMRAGALAASASILSEYSVEHQREDLAAFYRPLLAAPATAAQPPMLAAAGAGR